MAETKDFYHFEIGLGLFDLRKGSDLSSENISFLHLATSFTLFTSQNVLNQLILANMRSRERYVYDRFPPSNKPYNRDRFQDFHELVTESASPHRVILGVPTWQLDPACLRYSAWGLFQELIPDPKKRPIKFEMVALSIQDKASHLVIDVNNFNNDFVSAEKTKTVIPTYYCRKWDDCYIYLVRTPQHDEAIAKRLEVLHRRSRSGAKIPLFEDHTKLVDGYPCTSDIVF